VLPDGLGFSPSVLPIVGVFWANWLAVVTAVLPGGVVVCASVVVGAKISFWAPEVVFTSGAILAGSRACGGAWVLWGVLGFSLRISTHVSSKKIFFRV
jgi:hypothetical protein